MPGAQRAAAHSEPPVGRLSPDGRRGVDRGACSPATAAPSRARSRWWRTGVPSCEPCRRASTRHTGSAATLGLTGAPGVGKSTLATALVRAGARRGATGGRARRRPDLALHRAEPCWGTGSGCRSTPPTRTCSSGRWRPADTWEAWRWPRPRRSASSTPPGYDLVIVETVGVGQAEVDVAAATDTAVVVLAPGLGDAVQMAKAGILEVADVFVVNKADRDGAPEVVRELRQMLHLGPPRPWDPPVLATAAATDEGLADCGRPIEEHARWADASGARDAKRRERLLREVESLGAERLRLELTAGAGGRRGPDRPARRPARSIPMRPPTSSREAGCRA